jgi:hypothetical protein
MVRPHFCHRGFDHLTPADYQAFHHLPGDLGFRVPFGLGHVYRVQDLQDRSQRLQGADRYADLAVSLEFGIAVRAEQRGIAADVGYQPQVDGVHTACAQLFGLFEPMFKPFDEVGRELADPVADQGVQALGAEWVVGFHRSSFAWLGATCADAQGGGRCGLAYR